MATVTSTECGEAEDRQCDAEPAGECSSCISVEADAAVDDGGPLVGVGGDHAIDPRPRFIGAGGVAAQLFHLSFIAGSASTFAMSALILRDLRGVPARVKKVYQGDHAGFWLQPASLSRHAGQLSGASMVDHAA